MTGAGPLSPRRYVVRHIRSRPARSALIVAGVAIAVAFFVLFGALSAGLADHIDEELSKPRPARIYLESGSPTPFDRDDLLMVRSIADRSEEETGVSHWTLPRVELPLTSRVEGGGSVRLWGVGLPHSEDVTTPPYDLDAPLAWGRHLDTSDDTLEGGPLACVLGARALETLFPDARNGTLVSLGPDGSVDPWWMPDASDYPLEGRAQVTAEPRGPVQGVVVGAMEPGLGEQLDWGVFVPLDRLLLGLGQMDDPGTIAYYPRIVVSIEDGTQVDVRDLEKTIVQALPGIEGTDDAWDPGAFEATYGSAARALDGWLTIITGVMVVMLVAGVSDTTLVAVTDRRREIATLRAVGIGRRQVSRLVLEEVVLLAAAGLLVGLAVGSGLALLFGHLHEVTGGEGIFLSPVALHPWVLGGAALLALGSTALATAYPAFKAAGQAPTEALRYE